MFIEMYFVPWWPFVISAVITAFVAVVLTIWLAKWKK